MAPAPNGGGVVADFTADLAAVRLVIDAAGGGSEIAWAAGMVASSGRKQIVITSDRGRSWLPVNALLPEDVVLPWSHESSSRWEGLIDPARVIVEYSHAMSGELTALSSTHSSAPNVAAGVPFVHANPVQRARPELLTGRVADRVILQVPAHLRDQAARRTDRKEQLETVWGMAWSLARGPRTVTQDHILRQLDAQPNWWDQRRWVAALPWAALMDDYRELAAQEQAARADVRNVGVGELDTEGGSCRPLLFQLYAVEALLALRNTSSTRALHAALYPWWMSRYDATVEVA